MNLVAIKFKTENDIKHDVSLEEFDTMLGETFDQIYNKYEKDIADAKLKGELTGKIDGKLDGKIEEKLEVAKEMIKKGLNLDLISELTKIPWSDLKKIVSATSINQDRK